MPEFDLIRLVERHCRGQADTDVGLTLGIGDDCALIEPPVGQHLAVSTDTLNEGIHFFPGTDAEALGHKSLAVSLSDLAAMGAVPRWAFLNLSLPRETPDWVDAFARGLAALADAHGVVLAGGDTCSGPLSVTTTVIGPVPPGRALTRAGARVGDLVVVSGVLGDAALARQRLADGEAPGPKLRRALERPEPRVTLGTALRGVATACIDLSDGLAADLHRLADRSGCGAEVELERLPASEAFRALDPAQRWALQTGGGDDYELCFTVPAARRDRLGEVQRACAVPLTVVGRMTGGSGLRWLDAAGRERPVPAGGYEHFASGAGSRTP